MITVGGFNTAIDRLVTLDVLQPGAVQRASTVQSYPGGKGVHVAQTIAALGEPVQLVGLVDAPHRNVVTRRMSERGVLFHGVEMGEGLRQCLALRERDGRMTEVLDPGPMLTTATRDQLLRTLERALDSSEALVLSGSLPRGFESDTYAKIVRHAASLGMACLVDASGETLRQVVDARPCVIKPNRDEAGQLVGYPVDTPAQAETLLRELYARGVVRPLVTLGEQGAFGFDGESVWHASLALERSMNAVGSGDCFLAGMAVAYQRGLAFDESLRLAVACGAANAMGEETGFVERSLVQSLLPKVRVQRIVAPARRA
ncbi:1-phosphofructokinase family hexose kinase [Dyella japonica]|uniref:Phosphofructokinase n=1 Tax=Dyella japonica A8 TaxID=1217721 RepID=A0A075K5T9_9GAMM|nr:hexose kinase [Dyella japonica]AIF47538.1 1-phosphofructokinase [Dyella japonica A8]